MKLKSLLMIRQEEGVVVVAVVEQEGHVAVVALEGVEETEGRATQRPSLMRMNFPHS